MTLSDSSKTVLIVDDDRTALDFLAFHLENAGYAVIKADTGKKAMQITMDQQPAVVMLDVYLPDEIGLELCSRIKEQLHTDPPAIIIMSAWAPSGDMAEKLTKGADDYIRKPIDHKELLPKIRAVLHAREARNELRTQGKTLEMVLDSIKELVVYMDLDHNIRWANKTVSRITGLSNAEIINSKCHEVFRNVSGVCENCPIMQTFEQGRITQGVLEVSSGKFWDIHGYPIYDDHGKLSGVVKMSIDITEQETDKRKIQYLALHDPLTGLGNRMLFMEKMSANLSRAKRYGHITGLLYLDLDGFKNINDTLGHNAGDLALKEFASRLKSCLRDSDQPARMGGDEFAVILPEMTGMDEAHKVAAKISQSMNQPLTIENNDFLLSVSIGISACPYHGYDEDKLITIADKAMYQAKKLKIKIAEGKPSPREEKA